MNELLTINQAAAKIGVSRQYIHRMIQHKRIFPPPRQFGRVWLIYPDFEIRPPLTSKPSIKS